MTNNNPFVQAHRYVAPDQDGHLDESLVEYGVDMLLECFSDEFTASDYQEMYENIMKSPDVRMNAINEWNDGGWYDISPFEWMNKFNLSGLFGKLFAPIKWLFALALGGLLLALAGIAALIKKGLHELALKRLENYLNRLVVLADTGWKKKKHKTCLVSIKDGYRKDCLIYAGRLLKGAGLITGEERQFPEAGQATEGYFAGHVFLPDASKVDMELLNPTTESKWFGLKKVSKDPWDDIKNTTDYTKGVLNEGLFDRFRRNRDEETGDDNDNPHGEDTEGQAQGGGQKVFEKDPHRFVTTFGSFFGYAVTEIFGDSVASVVKNTASQAMRGETMAALAAGQYENRTGKEDISNISQATKYGAATMQFPPSTPRAYEGAEARYAKMLQRMFEDDTESMNKVQAESEIVKLLYPGGTKTIINIILREANKPNGVDWTGVLVKEDEGTYTLEFMDKVMGNSIPFTTLMKFNQFLSDNGIDVKNPSDPNVAGQIINILKRNRQDTMAQVFTNDFRSSSRQKIKDNTEDEHRISSGKVPGGMAEAQNIGQAFMQSVANTPYTNFAMYMKMKQDMDAFLSHLNTSILNIINRVAKVVYDKAQAGNNNAAQLYQFIVGKGDPKANNRLTYMWNSTCMRKLREQVTLRCNEMFASAEFKYLFEVCLISMAEVMEFATTGHVTQFTETDLQKIEGALGQSQTHPSSNDGGNEPEEHQEPESTEEKYDPHSYNMPPGPSKSLRFMGEPSADGIPEGEFYRNSDTNDLFDIRIYDSEPDYAFFNIPNGFSNGLIPEVAQPILDAANNGETTAYNGYIIINNSKPNGTSVKYNNDGWGRMHKDGTKWVLDFPCVVGIE